MFEVYDHMTAYDFIFSTIQNKFLTDLVDNQVLTLQALSCKEFSAFEFITDDLGLDGLYYYLGIDDHNIDGFRAEQGLDKLLKAMQQSALK